MAYAPTDRFGHVRRLTDAVGKYVSVEAGFAQASATVYRFVATHTLR